MKAGLVLYHSHPVASANGTVGIRSVDTSTRSAFKHFTPRARNSIGLGGRLYTSGSIGAGSTGLLVIFRVGLASSLSDGLGVLLVLVDSPVEYIVVLEALTNEEIPEDLAEIAVVRLVVKSKGTGVVQVDGKLVGEATAQDFSRGRHLLLHNAVILLLLRGSLQTLPRERSTAKVEHDVAERLHVVTARLLNAQVGVDGCITCSAGQILVLTVRDMEMSLGISVFLSQTKINDIDLIAPLANAHEEIIRFDITMDKRFGVNILDSGDQLVGEQQDGFQREFAVAEVEEVFQARTKEIEHHRVVVTLGTKPANERNTDTSSE